jgi:hypothetical protein
MTGLQGTYFSVCYIEKHGKAEERRFGRSSEGMTKPRLRRKSYSVGFVPV